MAAFTLAHVSDPHLPPLPRPQATELVGKRALGYLNWTRNRHKYHRREVVDALVSDLKTQAPDHVAVTGDLVNLALNAEFPPALAWLQSVGAPDRVTAIPGNHDAYVRATRHRFAEAFADYVSGDDKAAHFPTLRRRGPIALISLSSALPTPPFMATGTIGRAQLERLEQLLAGLAQEPVFRVLMVHHPLQSKSRVKRLTDSGALRALLKRHSVELILHGHDHVHSTIRVDGTNGTIPVIGVPSASALAHGRYPPAAYNLYRIERDNVPSSVSWHCEQIVRSIDEKLHVQEISRTRLV
jgi:3',5'-cyclic AMP phosphodiesterase CpdA